MTTQFYSTPSAAAMPAHLLPCQPVSRAPKAPWIETGFVQIPIEFFHLAASKLSARAQKIYFLHCSKAKSKGEGAGLSYAYRETLARILGCSLDTIDRGNTELERAGLIEAVGRRYPHGGATVHRLKPPSKWTLERAKAKSKSAAGEPQICVADAADLRPITKAEKHLKPKKQQTAREVLSRAERAKDDTPSVEDVVVEEMKSVEEVPPSVQAVVAQLEAHGIETRLALRWVTCYGEALCLYQLERLQRQKNVHNRVGWLRCALLRGDKDATTSPGDSAPAPAPRQELSPEELARRQEQKHQQKAHEAQVAEQVLASLDSGKQAYVLRCVELEGATLARVIQREENYAFTLYLRQKM